MTNIPQETLFCISYFMFHPEQRPGPWAGSFVQANYIFKDKTNELKFLADNKRIEKYKMCLNE